MYMKKIIILMFVLFSIMQTYESEGAEGAVMCTMDAKQCSDWSWVGRTGPNCEFVCPGETKEPKVCTREYMPVCAEVQIQCIKAPCYPIRQTFSNKCELESNSLATYLYDWECLWKSTEAKIESRLLKVIVQNTSSLNDVNKIAMLLERVYSRSKSLAEKNWFGVKASAYNLIWNIVSKYLQEKIYTPYIEKNISSISPVSAVLWWNWYLTKIEWFEKNKAKVEYEDGHIAESIEIEIKVVDGKIKTILK